MEQPKKRHKTLIPLSKSHHQVLMLAQILRSDVPSFKGMPDSLREKIDYMKASL